MFMDNLVRRILGILIIGVSLIMMSCSGESKAMRDDIGDVAELAMQRFVDKETNELLELFSDDIRNNRKEETVKELEELYSYFDEEIDEYEYDGEGGGEVNKRDGKVQYYNCHPSFIVTTDDGVEYVVEFSYNYIWDENPEKIGISKIRIYARKDYSNMKEAGIIYYNE